MIQSETFNFSTYIPIPLCECVKSINVSKIYRYCYLQISTSELLRK